jgi:nucleoside-diphosphate-sugar epimerase
MKADVSIEFLPPRPGDPFESQANIEKARTLLGYDPKIYFEEGLRRTVEWFVENKSSARLLGAGRE